jgi:hypothetical protein
MLDNFFNSESDNMNEEDIKTTSKYIKKWFAPNSIKQMLIYKSLIPNYKYQDLLRVLLSRSIRSARLTFHFKLTRLKHPVYEPYVCYKHRNKVCAPVQSLLKFIKRYSKDTIKRIKLFSEIRTDKKYHIINADSRLVDLSHIISEKFEKEFIDGIIISPPYVGLIDYHKQHRYAYELFGIEEKVEKEIGRRELGKSKNAQEDYKNAIAEVFKNLKQFLRKDAKVYIVANDNYDLYEKIAEIAGYDIVDRDIRPVTKRASSSSSIYTETIFHFVPKS